MRVVLQRVKRANCIVNQEEVSKIEKGYLLLVGFTHTDTIDNVNKMAKKIANLRVFEDEMGKMNLSIKDVNGSILAISQFTLYADPTSGNRPSFINAMKPTEANALYEEFVKLLNNEWQIETKMGVFGADMELNPVCDGPVTINLEF
ncbi:MAG: D-tyrosyl-tRNA(Tyr) deacylase [Bacilli bacterium]|nr:D-tyrosyl-tRNA(Tyr) deacylase [Bacilli bacterium]